MENKLEIQLGENKIVAEVYGLHGPEFPPELTIYLKDNKNNVIQDICIVRPHYDYNRHSGEWKTDNDFVDCIVWGESNNDDYTDKHVIAVYEEEA